MISIEQIQQMTPEELAALNKKLIKKLIVRRIVVPMAVIAGVHVAVTLWEKKQDAKTEN